MTHQKLGALSNLAPEVQQQALSLSVQLVLEAMKSTSIEQLLRESGSKHIAAAHEAGHAIVNTAFGRPVRRVYIERVVLPLSGEPAWSGWCITKHRPPDVAPGDVEGALNEASIQIAGYLGEERVAGRALPASSTDEVVVAQLLCQAAAQSTGRPHHGPVIWKGLVEVVRRLIDRYGGVHDALRAELESGLSLKGRRLAAILEPVKPVGQSALWIKEVT